MKLGHLHQMELRPGLFDGLENLVQTIATLAIVVDAFEDVQLGLRTDQLLISGEGYFYPLHLSDLDGLQTAKIRIIGISHVSLLSFLV